MIRTFVLLLAFLAVASSTPTTFSNVKCKLQPIFSPDNSYTEIKNLIDTAKTSLDIQNQYIYKFKTKAEWLEDGNGLVPALLLAHKRGVKIRVIVNGGKEGKANIDKYGAGPLLASYGIEVKYFKGSHGLSYLHNKGVIVDGKTVLVSSINWSEPALTKNRESGVIIYHAGIAGYYADIFETDWAVGEELPRGKTAVPKLDNPAITPGKTYPAITTTFSATAYSNPDKGATLKLLQDYFLGATKSIHATMYQITSQDIVNSLQETLKQSPKMDLTLLVSYRRLGFHDPTEGFMTTLNGLGANTYLTNHKFTFTHAKFWMIDSRYTFIHSGNWAGTSFSPTTYSGSNREWGIVFDSPCITKIYDNVFQADRLISTVYGTLSCDAEKYDACGICGGSSKSSCRTATCAEADKFIDVFPDVAPAATVVVSESNIDENFEGVDDGRDISLDNENSLAPSTNSVDDGLLSDSSIVALVIGAVAVLMVLSAGIFYYRRQANAKSGLLDTELTYHRMNTAGQIEPATCV